MSLDQISAASSSSVRSPGSTEAGSTAAGSGTSLHLIERFRRVDRDTLLYEYTVDDSTTFTRPFTAVLPMKRGEAMFEYACHEGNYGLFNMLAGARVEEATATSEQ